MPNGTRNNSKNKSNTIQNDRFKEIINYICTRYKINQNELVDVDTKEILTGILETTQRLNTYNCTKTLLSQL